MLNHITVQGRIGKDIELRRTGSGKAVASFSVACDRDFSDKATGKRETDWIDVVCWNSQAEFVAGNFKRGQMAIVSGRLAVRRYVDKEGNNRRTAEVVADNVYFGESRRGADNNVATNAPTYTAPAPASDFAMLEDQDEALPF